MSLFKSKAAPVTVSNFIPQDIQAGQTAQAGTFVRQNVVDSSDSFVLNHETATHIGLSEAKTKERQKQFDQEVFKYVQKIKDGAHGEAYEAGFAQGLNDAKAQALQEARDHINAQVSGVVGVINGLNDYRRQMFEANELEIVSFCYFMAEKIVEQELKRDPQLILQTVKKITDTREAVTVKVSASDYEFIHAYKLEAGATIDLSKISFESDASLKPGDVIVEGAQGIIDGRLSTRLDKLKTLLDEE